MNIIWAYAPERYSIQYSTGTSKYTPAVEWRGTVDNKKKQWWEEILPSLKQIDANMIGYVPYVTPVTSTLTPRIAETEEQRLRRLQDTVVARAQQETYGDKQNTSKAPNE